MASHRHGVRKLDLEYSIKLTSRGIERRTRQIQHRHGVRKSDLEYSFKLQVEVANKGPGKSIHQFGGNRHQYLLLLNGDEKR
ncbi:MAG: hypothetical protein Q9205_007933 [Flavoplaca limonia]